MTWNTVQRALLVAIIIAVGTALPLRAQGLESIAANDNRTPAGELHDGVLMLRLEMRKGVWHPEREDGEAIPVYAFGETGKRLQVPGPTIRVAQGTTIDISLHSSLGVPAMLRGLHKRPGDDKDVVTVAPGATEHVRFVAGAPGTYLYSAQTTDGQRRNNRVLDSLLGGALVVDPAGAAGKDRIFLLERWDGPTRTAINGKSWPYTERLNYKVGESVRWRVINASDLSHPMHLHGSFFSLDAEGDGEHYNVFEPGEQPLEFTQNVEVGETFEMSWVPREPGRWLYHCHRLPHMRLPIALDPADVVVADNHEHVHGADSEYDGMGGMIMGITVTGPSAAKTSAGWKPERRLELAVGQRKGDPRFYQLSLRDLAQSASQTKPQVGPALSGPVIVLNQNQPVEIDVVNKLKEATSIHWHGIELESYYDGVPEWGGIDDKKTPPVDIGQTFTVKMMPPHAGTFMYHTHWHDAAQLTGGIHGALIVLPPGQTYDPATDKSFLFSQGPNEPYGLALLLMNGAPQLNVMQLKTGTTYRFRFINITPSVNNLHVSLRNAASPVQWRLLAKDAVDAPAGMMRLADQMIAVGETYDFEYTATSPQELTLEGIQPNDTRRAVQTLIFSDR
jgi:FtsP/CotA-like multicopper oxidase with cupredoxin domain